MSSFSDVIAARSDLDFCWYLRKHGSVGENLERVLHNVGVLQPGGWANWQDSTMTDTGALLEMMFRQDCTVMSLRTEVGDPGADLTTRVAKVCAIMQDLGHQPPPAAFRDVISAAQGDAQLRFGAWLGLNMCDNRQSATLYADLPDGAADLTGLLASPAVTRAIADMGDSTHVDMATYTSMPESTAVFCTTTLDPAKAIPPLAALASVPAAPLLRQIDAMLDAGQASARPLSAFRFSLTTMASGGKPILNIHLSTKHIFGFDSWIGHMVRTYPGEHHAAYTGLADMLLPLPNGLTHHGEVSLTPNGDNRPDLSVNVAAPWVCPLGPL